ncbi:MAG: hypothetical protein P1U59_12375, partial [Alcanivorax sp.]|nr:hypothetical protein [Alcanivorax sp.]
QRSKGHQQRDSGTGCLIPGSARKNFKTPAMPAFFYAAPRRQHTNPKPPQEPACRRSKPWPEKRVSQGEAVCIDQDLLFDPLLVTRK